MIRIMDSGREAMNKSVVDKCLDPQLWHACAGGMVQMPRLNSRVFYFPQGHAEHALGAVDFDFGNSRAPPLVLCKVAAVRYLADRDTDDVYSRITLAPCVDDGSEAGDAVGDGDGFGSPEKPASFVKTLTQSDANNGGGFSVPRYCAETIFPRLDYSAEPPVQTILAKDVHGETWKFRHIYRGTPRRHLLTTGWSNFVNHKKLVAGDSIVFLRADNGDLCVGIRRAKKGIGGGHEYPCGWNPGSYGRTAGGDSTGRVRAESVVEAANLAANGRPFEVVYYPRGSAPEFCVGASAVRNAMLIRWCSGMRFKMPFETEDSSRISWFMGTISSVQVTDPIRWPDSPWRLLQVAWDEPDLLQNVKRVNPWLVELVTNIPSVSVSPFSPPRKKLRVPLSSDFSTLSQLPVPLLPSPFCSIQNSFPAGIQGARHTQFGQYQSDLHLNELQAGLFPFRFQPQQQPPPPHCPEPPRNPDVNFVGILENNDDISCWLKMGRHHDESLKTNDEVKTPHLLLFGQVILTEEQLSKSSSGEISSSDGNAEKAANFSDGSSSTLHQSGSRENSCDRGSPWYKDHQGDLETGQCKVFVESDGVGRTVDLSLLGSYQELNGKLADMLGIDGSAIPSSETVGR